MQRRSSNLSDLNGGLPGLRQPRLLDMADLKKMLSTKPEDDKHKGCLEVLRLAVDVDRIVARLKAEGGPCDAVRSVTLKRVLVDRLFVVLRSVVLHEAGGAADSALRFPQAHATPLGKRRLAAAAAVCRAERVAAGTLPPEADWHSLRGALRTVQRCLPRHLRELPPAQVDARRQAAAAAKHAAVQLKAKTERKAAAKAAAKEAAKKGAFFPKLEKIRESGESHGSDNRFLLGRNSSSGSDRSSEAGTNGGWFSRLTGNSQKGVPPRQRSKSANDELRRSRKTKAEFSKRVRESKEGPYPKEEVAGAYAVALGPHTSPATAQAITRQRSKSDEPARQSRVSYELGLSEQERAKATDLPPPPPFDGSPGLNFKSTLSSKRTPEGSAKRKSTPKSKSNIKAVVRI